MDDLATFVANILMICVGGFLMLGLLAGLVGSAWVEIEKRGILRRRKKGLTPMDAGIRNLVRKGKINEAVRMYQGFTGVPLEEARMEIERIQWEEGQAKWKS